MEFRKVQNDKLTADERTLDADEFVFSKLGMYYSYRNFDILAD
jgi:hypothetical protein